jgi:phosphatidylglycerol:prolipoprotein diacylglycerol transferase
MALALLASTHALRLGPLRFSAFGVCALVGLLLAFLLLQATLRMAGFLTAEQRDRVWDAALAGVLITFAVSRVLLIAGDLRAFLSYPLLVIGLPSLTFKALLLSSVVLLGYMRWRRLPLLRSLDAWAPCVFVFFAAIAVGDFIEGTYPGMPTTMPWGVLDPVYGRLHPVQLYAAVAAVWLCCGLLYRLMQPHTEGSVTRDALLAGGAAAMLLSFYTQPDAAQAHALLEHGQWMAIVVMAFGVALSVAIGRRSSDHEERPKEMR